MSKRILALTPNRHPRDGFARIWYALRQWYALRGVALDFAPIAEPWVRGYIEACPPDGAIVWNGYGPEEAVANVELLTQLTGKEVLRMESGWLPQRDTVYLSKGLGAYSSLAGEIERKQWPVFAATTTHPEYPKPGLPEGYVLVCGQVPGDSNLVSLTTRLQDIPLLVSDCTDRPVVYRPHPRHPEPSKVKGIINAVPGSDLYAQLAHAYCVVAGTSTTLIEAADLGTPAISLGLGVWSHAMVRNETALTLRHALAHAHEGWDDEARRYGIEVLRQQAQITKRRVKLSPRNVSLLEELI